MSGRTVAKNVRRPISLREDVSRLEIRPRADGKGPVDREAGIIYGVKITGLVSANGRRYLPEAVRKALPMYEGVSCRIDHPRRPEDSRESDDVFGWFRNVQLGEDGCPYGDLHYLKSHPMAARVCEAAERNPRLFGMSHNATGNGNTSRDGTYIVEEITEVRSVDLVADPATTSGLFEGKIMPKTIKAVLESALPKLTDKRRVQLKKLLEDDVLGPAMEPEMDAPADDSDWKQHLTNAIGALTGSDDPVAHDTAKKILAMLRPEDAAVEEEDDDEEEKPAEEEEDADKDKDAKESRQHRSEAANLREELAVRDLIEEAKLAFGKPEARKVFIKSLIPLTEAERKTAIAERQGFTVGGNQRPRSANLHNLGNGAAGDKHAKVKDGKSISEALLRR